MSTLRAISSALALGLFVSRAAAVQPVLDPAGTSFFDLPFPHELRRDADGTVSIAGFPFPPNPLLDQYRAAIEQSAGFGIASGVFLKFDGDIDPSSLPADPEASRQPGASAFLINIDPRSPRRGTRSPLWIDYRSAGDAYRDPHLLTLMPVPGHVLEQGTLYAAVLTDAVRDMTGTAVRTAPLVQRLKEERPAGAFEKAALPFYRRLWTHLERHEGLPREHVVGATVFRTGSPAEPLATVARFLRRRRRPAPGDLQFVSSNQNYCVFRGTVTSPQFQNGSPPFTASGTGAFVFDARGAPVVQREEQLEFILAVPKESNSPNPSTRGWPIALCMHGTGGDRLSFIRDGTAGRLADAAIASLSFDQPLHGLRPGGSANFYNPLYPLAFRDNTRQSAVDALVVDRLIARLRFDASSLGVPSSCGAAAGRVELDDRRRLFFGHSQGATVGPLFLALARGMRGGVLSAGGGNLMLNILTVDTPSLGGLTNKQLAEALLGASLDVFHPVVHLLQMGGEVADALSYGDRFATHRPGTPLSILFTHGMLDPEVTTPLTASMVVAARYPLVEPIFPNRLFPALPGYDYREAFTLAALPVLTPPVAGNLSHGPRRATGGLVLFELGDHFPVFHDPQAILQWTAFMRSLAYERVAVIAPRS